MPVWVNVREGSVTGLLAPRQAHLSDAPGEARCGMHFAPEDVARSARYRRCRRCSELAAPTGLEGDALAIVGSSPSSLARIWVIVRSNPDDWGLYKDGVHVASVSDLAEAGQIIADYEREAGR